VDSLLPAGLHVLERGWLSSNNVLFLGSEQTALVDSGYATHSAQTLGLVARLLNGRSLDHLLNTHLHSDHCGGNAALQTRYPAVRTAIPPGEAPAVRSWDEDQLSYRATGQECPRFSFNDLLTPGVEIQLGDGRWQVHAAPGHDPHAVILFQPASGVLVSGDALWEKGFGIVFPEMRGEPSFGEVAATLDLIESLHPRCVIPGHGRVFSQVDDALTIARARLAAFVHSPTKHARHALKVLIKFKLLDARRIARSDLDDWLGSATYLEQMRQRFAADATLQDWCAELLGELVRSGAARIESGVVFDN
jgi:glyoxylase-like metal-dependent hydrolase (beta-lactamase superfamily II)